MNTLRQFAAKPETVPLTTAWYLADLGEARGRQELFTKQSPQRLRVLREHARVERAGGRHHGKGYYLGNGARKRDPKRDMRRCM